MKKGMFLLSTAVIGLTIGLSSCVNEKSNKKIGVIKTEKVVVKEEPLKIGDKYEGGYIFFLDFEGKHGKICAPRFKGDESEVSFDDAFVQTKDLTLNGFSDWRLPKSGELIEIMKSKTDVYTFNKNDFKGSITGYWTSDFEVDRTFNEKCPVFVSLDINGEIYTKTECNEMKFYRVVRDF